MTIQTSVVFDYQGSEFKVSVLNQHLDPKLLQVEQRRAFKADTPPVTPWTRMSNFNVEVRHEGIVEDGAAPATEVTVKYAPEINWAGLDTLCEAVDSIDWDEDNVESDLARALNTALALVPGWYDEDEREEILDALDPGREVISVNGSELPLLEDVDEEDDAFEWINSVGVDPGSMQEVFPESHVPVTTAIPLPAITPMGGCRAQLGPFGRIMP